MQGVLVALFMMVVFWQLNDYTGTDTITITSNMTNLVGAIYFTAVVQMFTNF
jgi:hypothetical protein